MKNWISKQKKEIKYFKVIMVLKIVQKLKEHMTVLWNMEVKLDQMKIYLVSVN